MNGLALLALLFFASKGKASSSTPALSTSRKKVKGKSGTLWFTVEQSQSFGADRTTVKTTQVFATEAGNELVIGFTTFPEAIITSMYGPTEKANRARACFYAAPSTLTKAALSDFEIN